MWLVGWAWKWRKVLKRLGRARVRVRSRVAKKKMGIVLSSKCGAWGAGCKQ